MGTTSAYRIPKGGILPTVRLKKNASAFHGILCPFGGISSSDRYRAGLPPRHLPFSKFLTFSTVSSHLNLVGLFHPTSTQGFHLVSRAFPTQPAVELLSSLLLSCRYANVKTGVSTPSHPKPILKPRNKTVSGIPRIIRPRSCHFICTAS